MVSAVRVKMVHAGSSRFGALVIVTALLQGCSAGGPPSVPIFGSFFPAWVICAVGGIFVAVIIRALFIAVHINENLPAPPLVYLCLAISGGIAL
jgi:hypothetical protein